MSMRDKIAKAILGGKAGGPTPTGIHVYHSSPHDFDRFDLGKIGTGEGAQVYGHGIYAAENPAVSGQGGQYWKAFTSRFPTQEIDAANYLSAAGFDRQLAAKQAREQLDRNLEFAKTVRSTAEREDLARRATHLEQTVRALEGGAPVGPRTYEVNFKAKPEELLDWDKPIAGHPLLGELEKVGLRAHVASTRPGEPSFIPATGRDAYQSLVKDIGYGNIPAPAGYGNNPAGGASRMLADAGVPGIRYLDEGSRGRVQQEHALKQARSTLAGAEMHGDPAWIAKQQANVARIEEMMRQPPTHNYVAFDPSRLDIMAKYGVVGGVPLGAATMSGAFDPATYGERQ